MRALNLELAGIRDAARNNASTGRMRIAFWRELIAAAFERAGEVVAEGRVPASFAPPAGAPAWRRGVEAHPLFVPLVTAVASHAHTRRWLERMIDARDRDLDGRPPESLADLERHAEDTVASLLYLALEACGVSSTAHDDGSSGLRLHGRHGSAAFSESESGPSSAGGVSSGPVLGGARSSGSPQAPAHGSPARSRPYEQAVAAETAASHVGRAIGLINMVRALPVHARMGHRYMPTDLMRQVRAENQNGWQLDAGSVCGEVLASTVDSGPAGFESEESGIHARPPCLTSSYFDDITLHSRSEMALCACSIRRCPTPCLILLSAHVPLPVHRPLL
jgi:phytoene/squalene synthetase